MTVDRRHASAFPLNVRWWILRTRWREVSWKDRAIDLLYLVTGLPHG
jgi:hypothetical protein